MKRPSKFPTFSEGVSPILMMDYHRESAFGFGLRVSDESHIEKAEAFIYQLIQSYGEAIVPAVLRTLHEDEVPGFARYFDGDSVVADFFECDFDGEIHTGTLFPGVRLEFFGIGNIRDWYELHLKVWLSSGDNLGTKLQEYMSQ